MVSARKPTIPGIKIASNIWKTVQEIDLRPIREEAERRIYVDIVGKAGVGKQALATQMRSDPAYPNYVEHTPVPLIEPDSIDGRLDADLIILMVDVGSLEYELEHKLLQRWQNAGRNVLTFFVVTKQDDFDILEGNPLGLDAEHVIIGDIQDIYFIKQIFVPAGMELFSDDLIALGRKFPLFRLRIARKLINDTCIANAIYSFSTGLAEVIPVFDIPLNVADIVVLTKAQAFLIYKLGLLFGYSANWQDYVAEFGGVLGGGFLWRQVTRQLIGLVPVWGIVPKTAVAYAGTYVVGQVVLIWYVTGRHVTKVQVREIYKSAFEKGKTLAKTLASKVAPSRIRIFRGENKSDLLLEKNLRMKICPNCGKINQPDARFCQYCGVELE